MRGAASAVGERAGAQVSWASLRNWLARHIAPSAAEFAEAVSALRYTRGAHETLLLDASPPGTRGETQLIRSPRRRGRAAWAARPDVGNGFT
jgi:hypothetical protein